MKLVRTRGRRAAETARLLAALERRGQSDNTRALRVAERILRDMRERGDSVLRRYAAKYDGLPAEIPLRVEREEMRKAWDATPHDLQTAMRVAAANIRKFAKRQLPREWSATAGGLTTGQGVRPVDAVGCYVPSGRYPLPSTLLMTAIPAQVAGVRRIAVVSANPSQEILAAAWLAGVEEFYRVGGAQAIAALAYGTKSIPRVDKVVGPGNIYVTAAKQLVSFECGIDMLAGPTETLIASETGEPDAIASDLVAQAEHDPEARAWLVTTKDTLAQQVIAQVKQRIKNNSIARASIGRNGVAIVAASLVEAHIIVNRLAPEHLTVDAPEDLEWVQSAGSVFVGRNSPQPMGDYVSGPNHTLPTGGQARVRGGLSVMDFLKIITVQEYTAAGLKRFGPAAIALARAEGLHGHAEAVRAREDCG